MAGGNLGDLEMSLTLKTRIEDEIKQIVKEFNNLDVTGRRAQEAVDAITASVRSLANGKGDISELTSVYQKLRKELAGLLTLAQTSPEDFDSRDRKRLRDIQSIIDSLSRLKEAMSAIQKGSGLSVFPNDISTEANKAALAIDKVRSVISELGQWNEKATQANLGLGATRDIRQAAQDLQNYLAILEKIRENGGTHPTAGLTASDITRSAEYADAFNRAKQVAKDLRTALKEAAEAQERLNKQATAHSDFVAMRQEAQSAQELNERLRQQAQLKADIIERDRSATEHGTFMAMKQEAQATQELNERERELAKLKNDIIQRSNDEAAAEKRLAEAIAKTNQARREAIAASRQQAESLVRGRIKELEAQRRQLHEVFGSGKNILSTTELTQLRNAFSQITRELNVLRGAMNNLGSYSIKDLFAFGRGTSDFSPLISNMSELSRLRQSDNAAKREAIELEKRHQQEIAITAGKVRNDLAGAFASANREAGKTSNILNDIKSLFLQGGLVYGAKQFFDSVVQTGGEIVQQHVALRSILGDVQKADELFAQTQQLALQSPFKFGELNRDVKQLAAFGVEANDLYDTAKRLADIASGLGVSFERLGLAYGQVKARSWLDGKELRQFAYAGLPMLQKIAELYNATGKNGKTDYKTGDIKKMITKREVSFEDVQKVLWQMTDQGGQFYNMQLVLSETLLGRWNKLIDAWDIMVGKMAEGKSIIGGTFSFFIDRVTDLVLALDKMQPALLAFGGMLALKKGAGAIGVSNLQATLQAQTTAQLRAYAIEQQRLVVEGQITREQARQNVIKKGYALSDAKSVVASYERLALEGQLNALQLQKAVRQGLVTKELIQQLEIMGLISAKESELIVKEGWRARASLMAREAGSKIGGKIGGFFSGWNIATIGVTIAGALYSAWSSFNSKIKQDTETTASNARSTYESMVNTLKEVGDKKGSGEALQEQVDKMTETLKQSNLYTDSIKEQIASTNDLGKEYDILKEKIEEAKKANDFAPGEAASYAKAKTATGAGFAGGSSFFGQITGVGQDDIDENVDDVATALASLQVKMEKFSDTTKSSMEKVANSILGARAAGMSFEEKIATICRGDGTTVGSWKYFVKEVSKGRDDIASDLYGLTSDLNQFDRNFGEITTDDIPKYMEEMAKSRNMSMDEFSKWCQKHPEKFRTMLDQMLSEANSKVPSLVARLQQVAKAILNIGNTEPKKQGNKPKVWKNPLKEGSIDRKAFNKLLNAGKLSGGKGNFYQKEMAELIYGLNNGQSTGWENFGSSVQNAYKEARNENDAAKAAGEKAPFARKQAMLEALANQLGITLDAGKNKTSGKNGKGGNGDKKDKALETWKERLKSYQDARKTYEQYKDEYGEEETKAMIKEWYSNISDLDMEDYAGGLKKLQSQVLPNTAARKKFFNDLTREIKDFELSNILKPEMERIASDFKEALEQGTSQFNLYKKLFEKTASKEYASQAFKRGEVWDDNTRSLRDQFEEMTGLTFNADISDATAKKYLKEKMGAQGDMAYDLWKQTADLVHENYTNALEEGADAISQTLSTAQKLKSITAKYDKKRTEAGGDDGLKARYDYLEKQEKSGVLFDQLKSQVNWDGVFGNLDNYTKKELRKVRKDLNELVKGGLLNGMQSSDIQAFYEGVSKLNNAIDGKSFGGMAELVKELADASKQYDDAVEEYNEALAGGVDWQIEAARKKMLAAENQKRTAEGNIKTKKGVNFSNLMTLGNMFVTLGKGDGSGSTLLSNAGGWAESIAKMSGASDKNSSKIGSIIGMFAGLTEAINEKGAAKFLGDTFDDIGGAVNSIFKDFLGINLGLGNADYSDYNDAKAEYENLISVWDTLISKKKQYMSEHWGTEAENASREAIALLESEIEQAKELAKVRLSSGSSAGSHSIWYRMWQGSYDYNGTNWRDVAGEISSKYGVQFNSMEDMVNMSAETLEKIKTDYSGLWAHMDGDFKEYLDKIIEYGDQVDDMTESLTEKLTGNKFSDLISSWGSAMATMANSSDELVEHFEDNLKNAILNSMIENIYGKQIKALMSKTQSYAENNDKLTSSDGSTISEYTSEEYADIISTTEELSEQIEATRDYLQDKYHWSDNSSSSSSSSIKGITESTADVLSSYINAIRADVSVLRQMQGVYLPKIDVTTQAQLQQLTMISENTLRNADAAVAIQASVSDMRDMMNRAQNNTKPFYVYVK